MSDCENLGVRCEADFRIRGKSSLGHQTGGDGQNRLTRAYIPSIVMLLRRWLLPLASFALGLGCQGCLSAVKLAACILIIIGGADACCPEGSRRAPFAF